MNTTGRGTDDLRFTAQDIKKIAGLSYRQLSDWDSKGLLGDVREGEGWRTFSPKQAFVLLTCATLREQLGVPLESLGYVADYMLDEGADHFLWAAETVTRYGFAIYLLTDFRNTFIMQSDLEFEDMLRIGYFRTKNHGGYALLYINPLVNAILDAMGQPPVETRSDFYKELARARSSSFRFAGPDVTQAELRLLKELRGRENQTVVVHVKDGGISGFDVKDSVGCPPDGLPLEDVIKAVERSGDYQTLTISKHRGRFVSLNRHTPVKLQ